MPAAFRQPWAAAAVGVLLLGGGIALATRVGDDVDLGSGRVARLATSTGTLTDTAVDLTTTGIDLTDTVVDLDDVTGSDDDGVTTTATDVGDGTSRQLSGFPAVDPDQRCAWLVALPDEDPAKLFLVAWPRGTDVFWEPFELEIPAGDRPLVVVDETSLVLFDGITHESIDDLDAEEIDRLLGMERCGHDGIVVADAGSVAVE